MKNVNKKDTNNAFMQGYACAVANLIYSNNGVETDARELFKAGFGEYNLKQFRKWGIEEFEIQQFKKYRKQLK